MTQPQRWTEETIKLVETAIDQWEAEWNGEPFPNHSVALVVLTVLADAGLLGQSTDTILEQTRVELAAAIKALNEASNRIAALKSANDEQARHIHRLLNPSGGKFTVTFEPVVLLSTQEPD